MPGPIAVAAAAQEAVHRVTDHAAEEHHKGVHHALDQRHGDHVAVGHVGHLVADHGLDLFLGHALQQAGRHGHQRRVLEGTRGERIGRTFVDGDLGHADAGLLGEALHGLHDPGFVGGLRLVDHARAGAELGHGLAHQQRDDGAAKTDHEREPGQRRHVQAIGGEESVHPQDAGGDQQHRHHGEVGQDKQQNAFHGDSRKKTRHNAHHMGAQDNQFQAGFPKHISNKSFTITLWALEIPKCHHKRPGPRWPPTSPVPPAPAGA